MIIFLQFVVLLVCIIVHELSHGWMAYWLGDPTAKQAGRLSLNPIVHLDPVGSVLLPLLALVSGSQVFFGWAKPVPVQSRYFHRPRQALMWVALAGPIANFFMAIVGVMLLKVVDQTWMWIWMPYFIQINLLLGLFNLFPIPPLDGSRILAYFGTDALRHALDRIEPYGFLIIFALAYFGFFSLVMQWILAPILSGLMGIL